MSKRRRAAAHRLLGGLFVAASLAASTAASAQLAPTPVDSMAVRRLVNAPRPKLRFTIAPYVWMTDIVGETGVRDLSADLHISFSKLLSHLRFAAMATSEISYGPWIGIGDAAYTSVRALRTLSLGRRTPDLDFATKLFVGQLFAGYTFLPTSNVAIDLLAGGRIWAVDASLNISGAAASATRMRSPAWADALGGARVRYNPASRWTINVAGNGGGGGSRGTGAATGTVGYEISTRWLLFASYRYLHENYRKNDYFFDGHLGGPIIGGNYRWKP